MKPIRKFMLLDATNLAFTSIFTNWSKYEANTFHPLDQIEGRTLKSYKDWIHVEIKCYCYWILLIVFFSSISEPSDDVDIDIKGSSEA